MKQTTLAINCSEELAEVFEDEFEEIQPLCFGDKKIGHFKVTNVMIAPSIEGLPKRVTLTLDLVKEVDV